MLPKQKAVEIIFPLEISIIIWDLREWCFFLPEKSNGFYPFMYYF
ncbi:hypothetical protein [Spiroplasma endosymbiont of Zeiraphera isertana]